MLKTIRILRERVENWDAYPFSVPAIRSLDELNLRSRVCLFAGENGTGKSTLLEAIATHYGFGREGGNRNFGNDSTESNHSIDPLVRGLRLSFDRRTGAGYFLRAESFFNTVSHMDNLDKEPAPHAPPISAYYGGRSLHTRSHGETFFTLLDLKFRRNGLFLLDEPEAALSQIAHFQGPFIFFRNRLPSQSARTISTTTRTPTMARLYGLTSRSGTGNWFRSFQVAGLPSLSQARMCPTLGVLMGSWSPWEDANYCWVVICKNKKFHRHTNLLYGHKIPLGETDAVSAVPAVALAFSVRCDECGEERSYKPEEVMRVELNLPEGFTAASAVLRDLN